MWAYEYSEKIALDYPRHVATAGSRRRREELVRTMELCAIKPSVAAVFPADQARGAFDHLAQGGHFGKVAFRF
jgi:NADPH:quinone reductase-like Zn-dependent oxidoreductase